MTIGRIGAVRALRIGAGLLVGAGYLGACQWLMTSAPPSPWNAVGVLAPMLALVGAGCRARGQRALGALAFLGLGALCVLALLGRTIPPAALYLAQHAGVNLCLAAGFASTLRPGRTPLISGLARRLHGRLTPALAAYTRDCTLAWVMYFVGIATISLVLFVAAPFELWAVFANLISPLTIAAMLVGEYLFRYWLHPEFERVSIPDAIRSYRQRTAE